MGELTAKDPVDWADTALASALDAGAEQAEVCVDAGPVHRVTLHGGIATAAAGDGLEAALRVWREGRYGFFSGEGMEPSSWARRAADSVRTLGARATPHLPRPVVTDPTGTDPRDVTRDQEADLQAWLAHLREQLAFTTNDRRALSVSITDARVQRLLLNSSGVRVRDHRRMTRAWAWLEGPHGFIRRGRSSTNGDLDIDGLARELSEAAETDDAAAAPLALAPRGSHAVLLDPEAAADLVRAVGALLRADNVLGDLHALTARVGRPIASPSVTIIDDATLPGGARTRTVDDEGTPGECTTLIDRGKLAGFLHTVETAHELGAVPNGKAARPTLARPPAPAPSNLYCAAGPVRRAVLLEEFRDGLHVSRFSRAARLVSVTGRFTGLAEGWWVSHDGSRTPVSRIPLTANIFHILKGVTGCGDDVTFFPLAGGVGGPTMVIESMEVG